MRDEGNGDLTETARRIRHQQCRRDGFDQARCQQVERILCRLHEAASKAESSPADRVFVNVEGGTSTAVQGALVQLKCQRREAELLRAEAMDALASAGEVADVKAAPTCDAENSDPAANIGDPTMTALAFDRQRRLLGEVDALDSHKQGRQTSIESTTQLRSVMGGVEGIEERVLLSRTEP